MNLHECVTSQWFQHQAKCRIDSDGQFERSIDTLQSGDVVYSRYWAKFFERYHPRIPVPYVLISNYHDAPIDRIPEAVSDPKLRHWFGVNMAVEHEKMTPIPLSVSASNLRYMRDVCAETRSGVYLNCSPSTEERRELYRSSVWTKAPRDKRNYRQYFKDVAAAEYVLCPRGNGQDTYRAWESLALGARPVVKSSFLDRLYRKAGMAIVKEWTDPIPEGAVDQRILQKSYWLEQISMFKTGVA